MKILITGGYGKLAQAMRHTKTEHELVLAGKTAIDITNEVSIIDCINTVRPDCIIHTAALTKPMIIHEQYPCRSIYTNIVGTAYVAMACQRFGIKLVYISTDYVYPGTNGNYSEEDPVKPFTNYGWSKLGGECAVHMDQNSLIIRLALCNRPFEHEYAFDDMIKNYIYEDKAAQIILNSIHLTGILNVGGPTQSVYDFAKQDNPDIKSRPTEYFKPIPLNTSMNLGKMNEVSRRRQSPTTA